MARNPEVSVKEDFAFHMAIARSAKNPVLFDVLNYLSDLVFRSHRAVTQSAGLSPSAITYHERIAAAIRRRAPREARRVMLQHLDDVIRRADQLFGEGFGPPAGADGTPQRVASAPVRASRTRKEDRKGHVGSNGRHR